MPELTQLAFESTGYLFMRRTVGLTDVALELAPYKDRCPQSLREKVLAGVQKDGHTRE